ncbi:hypothetical protein GQ53DRAFT_743539 [Thozetella sp. PMI_491]|nr:hypothetical protein GQ53DRAFT_743539 [Thozetella sp. PMI_491]
MKLSSVLLLTTGLVAEVAATDRGAAERALIWSAYLMDEVFTDSSQWTIAADCVPKGAGRTGLRGQTGRCTFLDLLEHIWTKTPKFYSDPSKGYLDTALPDRDKVFWNIDLDNIENLNPKQIADGVYGVSGKGAPQMQPKRDASGKPIFGADGKMEMEPKLDAAGNEMFKKGKNLTPGYVGAFLIEKVMKGVSATEHFKGMGMIGDSIAKAKVEVDKLSDSDGAKAKLNQWHTNSLNAADYIIDLRESDGNKVILSSEGLKKVDGLKVIPRTEPAATKALGWVTQYQVPDEDAMAKDPSNLAKFGDEAGVRNAISDRLSEMVTADGGNHEAMVKEIKKTRLAIASGSSATCTI